MNNPPKILIVDDAPVDALLLSRLLQRKGYLVLSADSGTAAYNLAISEKPDLVLMDVMMPGLDGYEACKLLRENAATSDIPVIFVTSRAETVDKVKGLDMGGVDYITKPFQLAEVMARVNTHLRLKAAHEENLEYHKVLLQTQKMASISALAGGVAHNINNLMGAVIGYADMLQECLDHNDRAYHYTEKVLVASQRASDLATDLLTYAGARHSEISSVDMLELLQKMIRLYGADDEHDVHIDLQAPLDIPRVQADSSQMLQALSNILINSQEVTPDGGTVTICVSTGPLPPDVYNDGFAEPVADTYLIISISDTGPGMDKETADMVFEPFFTTKKTVGVGLGLSAAYGIIQKHKGAISVETELEEGSTFHVYLPTEQIYETE